MATVEDGRKRIVSGPFRYVRPHGDRFDVHFHDDEAPAALEELRQYRRDWVEKLRRVEAELAELDPAHGGAQPERFGRLGAALRARSARPPREVVVLRYEAEDLRRSLATVDAAIDRVAGYIARRGTD